MLVNVEAREALDDFATADVLILSRSSLGYVAGVLNPYGLVVYAPWWHPACLAGWSPTSTAASTPLTLARASRSICAVENCPWIPAGAIRG